MFDTAIAGSLPKPSWLPETEKLWPNWRWEEADTIGRALQFVPRERLIACTDCGLAPMGRAVAEPRFHALAQGAALARQRAAPR